MMNQDAVIEKIQKLLNLANSDNENEAKVATARANELLIKYNLEMQTVVDHQNEYGQLEAIEIPTLKLHQTYLTSLLMEHFMVKCIISRKRHPHEPWRMMRSLTFVGTKANTQIAAYVFDYLNEIYPKLWLAYRDAPENRHLELRKHHRASYFTGLNHGITKMLKETKMKVEQQTGLVLVEDPDLSKFVEELTKGRTANSNRKDNQFHRHVFEQGKTDGENVKLRKAIKAEQNDAPVFLVEGKKN